MVIAFIPARSGSKRIPNKNIRSFFGHPLIAYAIQSALDSEIFDHVFVSSDSEEIGKIAQYYGAEFIKRPPELSKDLSPDAEWIEHAFKQIEPCNYAILRPTNPFRTSETIKRAWKEWDKHTPMKAIEPAKQHPLKTWKLSGKFITPYIPGNNHLLPIQNLDQVYIQNGCLEFRTFYYNKHNPIYQPFFTEDYEGFDLNYEDDWLLAEALAEKMFDEINQIRKEHYYGSNSVPIPG